MWERNEKGREEKKYQEREGKWVRREKQREERRKRLREGRRKGRKTTTA